MKTSHYALSILAGLAALAPTAFAQDTCTAYFTRSTTLGPLVTDAYAAMHDKKADDYPRLLPQLEAALNALPATEIKAEACDGNHVNAYTVKQFTELTALKSRGLATGFPNDFPIVKQPELNQGPVAYAVGWIKYEQGNFDGALAAYAKGLAMFPYDSALQQENLATLMQLGRYNDVITFADKILADGTAMEDAARGKTYGARALAQYLNGDLQGADSMIGVALKYANTPEHQNVQKQIRDAIAAKN